MLFFWISAVSGWASPFKQHAGEATARVPGSSHTVLQRGVRWSLDSIRTQPFPVHRHNSAFLHADLKHSHHPRVLWRFRLHQEDQQKNGHRANKCTQSILVCRPVTALARWCIAGVTAPRQEASAGTAWDGSAVRGTNSLTRGISGACSPTAVPNASVPAINHKTFTQFYRATKSL